MKQQQAEEIALLALGWIAGQDALVTGFLGASGVSPDQLRAAADDPDLLAALMDFLMQDDRWVLDFCADHALSPDICQQVRAALPGGQVPHWT